MQKKRRKKLKRLNKKKILWKHLFKNRKKIAEEALKKKIEDER